MYLPFDKSILSNIPCFGQSLLGPMVITSGIIILKILFFISLSPMMILITEGSDLSIFYIGQWKKGRKPLADTSNLQEEVVKKLVSPKSDSLVSSAPVAKK